MRALAKTVLLVGFLGGFVSPAASADKLPDVDAWAVEVSQQRIAVQEAQPKDPSLDAKKRLFELSRTFPVLTDWVLQDLHPDGYKLLLPSAVEEAEASLLKKLGVAELPAASKDRLALYAERCRERREKRLRTVLDKWAPFAFTEMYSISMSFIGYTEGLSDARHERFFKPGTKLTVLHFDAASTFGRPEHLLEDPHGVMRDVDVSYDLNRLLFAWKKSDRLDDYHIYEYDLLKRTPRQLTFGLGRADYEPAYIPGGDIIFASTRPEQSVPCWWTEISNLYRMNAEGRYIRRLAIDQVHTLYPQVLNNGRVCYTRWDYSDRGQNYPHPVFAMNPDGQAQRVYYGGNSWFPNSLLHTRAIPGSEKVMSIAAGHHTRQHGKLVMLDVREGRDEGKGMQFVAPIRGVAYERVDVAQQHGDQFRYPFPLSETELLVSYVPDWGYQPEHPDLREGYTHGMHRHAKYADLSDYGLYWMNVEGEREYLYGHSRLGVQRPVALGYKPAQHAIPDTVAYAKDTGTYYVHDVYQGEGLKGIPRGEAKKIRVVRLNYRAAGVGQSLNSGEGGGSLNSSPVSIGNGTWDVKEIIGDAEIHSDGSALFEVPADESIYLQVLNKRGQVIQTTRTWDTVRPGEQKACVGCHDKANANFHPFRKEETLAWKQPPQKLKSFYGPTRGFSFQKEVQPILDRHCVSCHDGSKDGLMDLRGHPVVDKNLNKRHWTRSYLNLTGAEKDKRNNYAVKSPETGMVSWISKMSRPTELPPYFAGAAKSPLLKMLDEGHGEVALSEEHYHKLAAWMDLLVPFSGTYREGQAWNDHEMRFYDYYETKRRDQHREEALHRASLLLERHAQTGDSDSDDMLAGSEKGTAAAFTRAAYRPAWSGDLVLQEGAATPLVPAAPFLFDRVTLRAQTGEPVTLTLRKGDRVVHAFTVQPGRDSTLWHAGQKALHSGDMSLTADRRVSVSIAFHGIPVDQLPGSEAYRPHLAFQ